MARHQLLPRAYDPPSLAAQLLPCSFFLCWAIFNCSFQSAAEAAQPLRPKGFVNDFAGVIDPRATEHLESVLRDLERQTGAEVAVVTVPTVPEGDIERAAADLFQDWGIGKRGKDNGVLILCAVQDRRVRIEVGYSLEAILPDARTGRIIDEQMLPRFRAGDLSTGLVNGALAVAGVIARGEGVTLSSIPPMVSDLADPSAPWHFLLILLFFGGLIVFAFLNPSSFFWLLLGMMSRGSGSAWGGEGGFGGGFGGFGGGMSGGGGASRSW